MPIKRSTGYRGSTYRKRGTGKTSGKTKRRRRQTGGFLNRYDFEYAGRDTVNQVGKIAPGIINKATAYISINWPNRELIRSSDKEEQK